MTTLDEESTLTTETVESLAVRRARPSVSLYMPTFVAGREVRQNSIRFSNLVSLAEERLDELGVDDRAWFGEAVDRLGGDGDFWQHQRRGLAVFVSAQHVELIRLSRPVDEAVFVTDRYHLRPLLAELDQSPVAVLALSQGQVALYEATGDGLTALDYDGPGSIEDEQWFMDRSEQLQSHPTSQGGTRASFHAHDPSSYEDADRERFLRSVAESVTAATQLDLVVVATDRLASEFENHFGDIAATVEGSPDGLDAPTLGKLVKPAIDQLYVRAQTARTEHIRRAIGSSEATTGVRDVLEAAITGRAAAIVIGTDAEPEWGRYDPAELDIEPHAEPEPWDVDLLDAAVHEGLGTGADVGVTDDLPDGVTTAARLRY